MVWLTGQSDPVTTPPFSLLGGLRPTHHCFLVKSSFWADRFLSSSGPLPMLSRWGSWGREGVRFAKGRIGSRAAAAWAQAVLTGSLRTHVAPGGAAWPLRTCCHAACFCIIDLCHLGEKHDEPLWFRLELPWWSIILITFLLYAYWQLEYRLWSFLIKYFACFSNWVICLVWSFNSTHVYPRYKYLIRYIIWNFLYK